MIENLKLVLVLGNKLLSSQIHTELKGRMDTGINIFKEKSADYLILSGGSSNPFVESTECEIMRDYAIKKGIQSEKIILDFAALDTIGNAYFTRKIVEIFKKNTIIYIISSCYHMERVKFVFKQCYKNNYNLIFDFCYQIKNPDAEKKEKISIDLAKKFFENINPGDIEKIRWRLFTEHELYKSHD